MISKFVALTAAGLLAGSFLYGCLNLVPTFSEVPLQVHLVFRVQLMKHNSVVMQLLMAVSVLAPLWYAITVWQNRPAALLIIVAATFALTSLLVTRFGNVPINQVIKTWSATHPPGDWKILLERWNTYNIIRTGAAIACFLTLLIGDRLHSLRRII
jgi:uncharacterized membrane protein